VGYNPNYKWINPTYPIYNWGYNPLTKWDEPPSRYPISTPFSFVESTPFVSQNARGALVSFASRLRRGSGEGAGGAVSGRKAWWKLT